MKYRVHLYPVVRIAVEVEAPDQVTAIDKAVHEFHANISREIEDYADDMADYALVDEDGDEEYAQSCWYDYDGSKGLWSNGT